MENQTGSSDTIFTQLQKEPVNPSRFRKKVIYQEYEKVHYNVPLKSRILFLIVFILF